MQLAAELGKQPLAADKDVAGCIDLDAQAHLRRRRHRDGRRRRLARAAHIQHGDGGRQPLGNIDIHAVQQDFSARIHIARGLALHGQIGIEQGGQQIARKRAGIPRGDAQIDGKRRRGADRSGQVNVAWAGRGGKMRDGKPVAGGLDARGNFLQVQALHIILHFSVSEVNVARHGRGLRSAGNGEVQIGPPARAAAAGLQHRVEQADIQVAARAQCNGAIGQ